MALNSLLCADVPLRTYTLTHSFLEQFENGFLLLQMHHKSQIESSVFPWESYSFILPQGESKTFVFIYFQPTGFSHMFCVIPVGIHFEVSLYWKANDATLCKSKKSWISVKPPALAKQPRLMAFSHCSSCTSSSYMWKVCVQPSTRSFTL